MIGYLQPGLGLGFNANKRLAFGLGYGIIVSMLAIPTYIFKRAIFRQIFKRVKLK